MEKEQFKKQFNLTENQFKGIDKVEWSLDLRSLTSIPEGFNPTVGGYLYLGSLTSIPEGFNPTVGGNLYLGSLTSIPEGFNPTVGGYLYLGSLTSIPEGFNPTVGGNLYLGSLISIPEGFNPTVGGSLDLGSLTSIPEGFNPTVGRDLYLGSGLTANSQKLKGEITWQNGKYISVDGIFTEVLSKKGNIYKVKKINQTKEFYLITDGLDKWSHGDTIKEAKEDLIYKISNRSKEDFKHLTVESKLTFKEAIECYRVITGACSFGTKDFIKSTGLTSKSYTIKEMIELTKNRYGNETFVNFFSLI